jgi:hypothetical protein
MIDLYWPTSNGRKITIMLHEVRAIRTGLLEDQSEQQDPRACRPRSGGRRRPRNLIYLAEKTKKLIPRDLYGRYDTVDYLSGREHWPDVDQMAFFHNYAEPDTTSA